MDGESAVLKDPEVGTCQSGPAAKKLRTCIRPRCLKPNLECRGRGPRDRCSGTLVVNEVGAAKEAVPSHFQRKCTKIRPKFLESFSTRW